MIGKTLESLSPEKQSDGRLTNKKVVSLFKTVLKYGNHRTEWIIRTNNRREIPVELSIAAIKLKGENILFIVLRDITPWKEAQNVLLHAKIGLEDAVKARTSELIAVNEELTTSRERLRHLSEYLQQAREDERTRIGREVHDHVGQFLTGLKMNLVYQIQNPQGEIGVLVEQTKLMVDEIDEVIHSVQGICSELRPTILGHFGLTAAIGWYLKDFEKRTGIRCKARTDSKLPLLDKNLDTLLFRIFQEVMTNIFRHAHATMVSVRLKCEGNALTLKIKDNGRGILKEEALHPRSFGIIGIRERVRFWGGQSDFKGVPGKGTIVTIWLPINNNLSKQRETKEAYDKSVCSR
jgi:signal transduction histidine kinase